MLISQLRCVPVCFYCSISLCRCQYFVVLVCFRRQKVQRLHRCQIFRRYGGNGKFVVLQHPHNGLGPGQSTGVNFQQHKGGVLPDTAHLPIKIAAVCDVVRVVGDVYIAAPVGRAQAVEMKNCRCGNGCSCNGSFTVNYFYVSPSIIIEYVSNDFWCIFVNLMPCTGDYLQSCLRK